MAVGVPFEYLEGRVSTASLKLPAMLSSSEMGPGSLLLGSRPLWPVYGKQGQKWDRRQEESMEA